MQPRLRRGRWPWSTWSAVTPEAPTLEACVGPNAEELDADGRRLPISLARAFDGRRWRRPGGGQPRYAPPFSGRVRTAGTADGSRTAHRACPSTSRPAAACWPKRRRTAGPRRCAGRASSFVVDTCTYITPILDAPPGSVVMTNSAKWAWYAPANLGVRVAFGTLEDCLAVGRSGPGRAQPAELAG